jgi:nicotinamide mononucleotide transporter
MASVLPYLEPVAVTFGLVSVWLSTRQHIASWPTALVNVSLYVVIFFGVKLYADMGLQFVYFGLSLYGWYQWKFGGAGRTVLPVSRTTPRLAAVLVPLGLLAAAGLGHTLARTTDAALPWVDSAATVTSLIAQWMMTRKLLECWLVWIAVDVVYVSMFIYKDLYLTALQYGVFLVLAVLGWLQWKRSFEVAHGAVEGVPTQAEA